MSIEYVIQEGWSLVLCNPDGRILSMGNDRRALMMSRMAAQHPRATILTTYTYLSKYKK